MAGFLPEHLPSSNIIGDNWGAGSAARPTTHKRSADRQANAPEALVNLSKRQNTLIEQRSILFKLKSAHAYDDPGKAKHRICRARDRHFYRCDIHAVSSEDERAALMECKQLVVEAGGSIVNDFEYLGGFLYELTPGRPSPIETGDMTAKGGKIIVEPWQPFSGRNDRSATLAKPTSSPRGSTGLAVQKTIDGLFACAKRKSVSCVDDASSSVYSQDSKQEDLTLMEMLLEDRQNQMGVANGREELDDAAEWVTLSDASEFEL